MSQPTADQSRRTGYHPGDESESLVEIDRTDSGITIRRIAVSLAAVLVIVGAIYLLEPSLHKGDSLAASISVPGSSSQAPRVGGSAPDFGLPNLDGKTVKLSDLRGRPVWINFWATWCPPCRAEAPDVEAAYSDKRAQGLVLLQISIGEDASTVRTYVEKSGMTSTVLVNSDETVASLYRVNGIPTHLFVDKDGIVRDLVVGGLSHDSIAQRLTAIMK